MNSVQRSGFKPVDREVEKVIFWKGMVMFSLVMFFGGLRKRKKVFFKLAYDICPKVTHFWYFFAFFSIHIETMSLKAVKH